MALDALPMTVLASSAADTVVKSASAASATSPSPERHHFTIVHRLSCRAL
jgi:hypothetical protein